MVCEHCSLGVEWLLVDGVQVAQVLVVAVPVQAFLAVEMVEHFKGQVVSAILHNLGIWVIYCTALWWIELIIRLHIVGEDVQEFWDPHLLHVSAEILVEYCCILRPLDFGKIVVRACVHEHGFALHVRQAILLVEEVLASLVK